MDESEIEIYRQRYETFRHLDKVRWQMLQLLVAIASATAIVLRSTQGVIEWWFYSLLGLALIVISFVMFRIGSGIRRNAIVLRVAAETVGDFGIPNATKHWGSIAHWIAILVIISGSSLIVLSGYIFFK